eukprot:m.477715 g.477715  ORF g.477715 m.477715 type:complete len:85 (+) comp20923_c0_seq1:55-309(+)
MDQFVKSLMDTKLAAVPQWAAKNLLNTKKLAAAYTGFASGYQAKYFGRKGAIAPMVHIMVATGVLGYAMEYKHLAAHECNRKHH